MAVALRLMRIGKKGHPNYRIVVKHKKSKQTGYYIENIGFYDPFKKENEVTLNRDRLKYWLEKGAIASEGLEKLLKKMGK